MFSFLWTASSASFIPCGVFAFWTRYVLLLWALLVVVLSCSLCGWCRCVAPLDDSRLLVPRWLLSWTLAMPCCCVWACLLPACLLAFLNTVHSRLWCCTALTVAVPPLSHVTCGSVSSSVPCGQFQMARSMAMLQATRLDDFVSVRKVHVQPLAHRSRCTAPV